MSGEVEIISAQGEIAVDGDLSEWDEGKAKMLTLFSGGGEDSHTEAPLEKYSAKISLQYDQDALYVAVWWKDPTPLGPEALGESVPPGDGLILHIPFKEIVHAAFWRKPGGDEAVAASSLGQAPLSQGKPMKGVTQGYRVTGRDSYTQEIRIPWDSLGGNLKPGSISRIGVELCYGGLDAAAGYKAWERDAAEGNRWGGGMGWGFMDGWSSLDISPSYNPANGVEVKLEPPGSVAPENPVVMSQNSEQTRTTRLIAVPAGKITIDGKLDEREWDTKSASTISSEPTLFPNRYSVDIHLAYSDGGLYAGLRWHTGGQHLNVNNPKTFGQGFDGGDSLLLRIGTDKVSHVDAWYYDQSRTPSIVISYGAQFNEGKEPDAISKGAALAVKPVDGGGYTEEIFLPWKLITKTGQPLKTGDSFRVILDSFFSGVEKNNIPFIVNAKMRQPSGVVSLPLSVSEDGFYTVVVDSQADSRTVRHLLTHAKMKRNQGIEWDGLDDDGKPVPAGTYTFRGLHHKGIGMNYLMTYNNPGTPPWQTDDGSGDWGGDHSPPQAVAADGDGIYLGWPTAEDGYGIIGCDFNGKKRWGFFMAPLPLGPGATAILASDGKQLYYANEGKENIAPAKGDNELGYFKTVITCLDRATGQKAGFSIDKPYHELSKHKASQVKVNWWWDLWRSRNFSLDTYAIHDDYFYSYHCAGGNLAGLAARDGRLYVSFRLTGEIGVYNGGDMTELARWKIEKPAGLTFTKEGELLAISGTSVVRINLKTGAPTPLVRAGLDAPVALAVDTDDAIYVSDWADAQCVKVFSKDGVPARVIGIKGGRPWLGKYDPNGMLLPRGIAIDKDGRLWVAEDDNYPRRVSVWNAKTGKFLKEFVGGTNYGATAGGILDPKNPRRAYSLGVGFDLDYQNGSYRPVATLWRKTSRDAAFGLLEGPNTSHETRFLPYKGRTLVATTSDRSIMVIGELLDDGTRWKPLAAIGGVFNRGDNPLLLSDSQLSWSHPAPASVFAGHGGENFVWTDLNDDGLLQVDEMQWRKQTPDFPLIGGRYWGLGSVDSNLNIITGGNSIPGNSTTTANVIMRFPMLGFTENGAPKYDINTFTVIAKPDLSESIYYDSLFADSKDNVFTVVNFDNRSRPKKFRPELSCYSGTDGALRWSYPINRDKPMGNICGEAGLGPISTGGEAGEIFGLTQWWGCYVPLFTTDGLFIDRLLRDPAEGGKPGPDVYRGETIQHLNKLDDGRIILSHGKNAHHLFEVVGLNDVKRFKGEFALTNAQSKQAAQLLVEATATREKAAPIRLALIPASTEMKIDAKLDEWDWQKAVFIGPKEGSPRAEAALRTDGKFLYLAYKVFKSGPFINKGDDIKQLFVSGDAVDFQFCADPAADPGRKVPVMGDCRILLSKMGGKPVAMLYRVKAPGAKQPISFRNPAGAEVVFDEVSEIRDARVAISDTPDGYLVEAAIPLKTLFDFHDPMWKGRVLRGDIGIIVADSTSRRIARVYRFNQDTQMISDLPVEARLVPANWGEIEVEE